MTAGLRLRLRAPIAARVDASRLALDPAAEAAELARREAWVDGDGPVPLGDLFVVDGTPDGTMVMEGDLSRIDGLGTGFAAGELVIDGNVGAGVGTAMRGGRIEIRGHAGARVGGATPGAKRGMTGGEIIVRGSAGIGAGAACRRGLIVVQGDAGRDAGRAMLAGSIIVLGSTGHGAGLWSKRGSIVALGPAEPPPTYRYACTYRPPHLLLTLTYLRARRQVPVGPEHLTRPYRRYSGDLAELGAGEMLIWTAA